LARRLLDIMSVVGKIKEEVLNMQKASRPTAAFIGVLAAGFALYFVMQAIQPSLPTILFDYNTWFGGMKDNALLRFLWLLGDGTEPHFHKTLLGGVFVIIGSFIAYLLDKSNSKAAGTPISYGTGLWPWIFLASWVSLAISGILYGGIRIEGDGWIPTFVPYVCVAAAVILIYGGNFINMLTGAVLGALFTTPITMFIRYFICLPMELPGVIGSVSGMWIGGILVFELCNILPWMKKTPYPKRSADAPKNMTSEEKQMKKNRFFIRRMLADYSEPMFVGNEIAGGMLVLGSMISWLLNPMHPYYGTGWFPALVLCQIITGAFAIYVYWPHWVAGDGFPSFVPVVSVAPAMVLTFGPSMFVIVFSAILGALLCPPIALMVNKKIPPHWGGMVGTTFSMAFCSFGVGVLVKYVLIAFPVLA